MSISIRKLTKEDAKPLRRLLLQTMKRLAGRYYPAPFIATMGALYPERVIARRIAEPDGAVLGAFDGRTMVGFIMAAPMSQGLYYVEWTGVAPTARRRGLLGRLLRAIEVPAKRVRCHKIYLYTSRKNIPAAKAYLKYGYRAEGILQDHFLGGDFLMFGKTLKRRSFGKAYDRRPDFPARVELG